MAAAESTLKGKIEKQIEGKKMPFYTVSGAVSYGQRKIAELQEQKEAEEQKLQEARAAKKDEGMEQGTALEPLSMDSLTDLFLMSQHTQQDNIVEDIPGGMEDGVEPAAKDGDLMVEKKGGNGQAIQETSKDKEAENDVEIETGQGPDEDVTSVNFAEEEKQSEKRDRETPAGDKDRRKKEKRVKNKAPGVKKSAGDIKRKTVVKKTAVKVHLVITGVQGLFYGKETAIKLETAQKRLTGGHFPGARQKDQYHTTLNSGNLKKYPNKLMGQEIPVKVTGYADNGRISAFKVQIPEAMAHHGMAGTGQPFTILMSGPANGERISKEEIQRLDFKPISPFKVTASLGYMPDIAGRKGQPAITDNREFAKTVKSMTAGMAPGQQKYPQKEGLPHGDVQKPGSGKEQAPEQKDPNTRGNYSQPSADRTEDENKQENKAERRQIEPSGIARKSLTTAFALAQASLAAETLLNKAAMINQDTGREIVFKSGRDTLNIVKEGDETFAVLNGEKTEGRNAVDFLRRMNEKNGPEKAEGMAKVLDMITKSPGMPEKQIRQGLSRTGAASSTAAGAASSGSAAAKKQKKGIER